MRIIVVIFLLISKMGLSQFSPIWTIPSDYSGFGMKSFNCNNAGQMMLITVPYDAGPVADLQIYTSLDSGQNWDSTLLANTTMSQYNASVTENGKFYIATRTNVYPTGLPPYQRKMVHRSLDNGLTWQYETIDTLNFNGQHKDNSFSFINDSTGMYFNGNGKHLTQDYGQTWQKTSGIGAENLGTLDDRFIFYWYQSAITVNPFSNQIDSFSYLPYCEGNVNLSFYNNGISYRMIFAQDGEDWGSEYNHNYASLNIDALPFGDQRAIHFPQRAELFDIDATQSCIHLVLDGRYVRSCDGGDTFYDVDAFNGNMNEQVMYIEFMNDTLGYLVSQNLINYEWHLWKTTNGGGNNFAPLLTNQFYAGVHELKNEISFDIYPNPASEEITIDSKEKILKIELYSMDGKLILSEEPNLQKVKLDLSKITQGTYMVKVTGSMAIGYSKIVKD